MKKNDNGSPVSPACKHGNGESASYIFADCYNGSVGIGILARAIANRPPNEDRIRGMA